MMQNYDGLTTNAVQGKSYMTPWPYEQAETIQGTNSALQYKMLYPEIFYKLHPHIMEACDQIDSYGYTMPTEEMVEQMSYGICTHSCRMHPELNQYMYMEALAVGAEYGASTSQYQGRQRGFLRDLVDIMLLTELFGRRRRYY